MPIIFEQLGDALTQDNIVLNTQNFDANEKLLKFATLQEQLDSQYEGHENYGDKLVKNLVKITILFFLFTSFLKLK